MKVNLLLVEKNNFLLENCSIKIHCFAFRRCNTNTKQFLFKINYITTIQANNSESVANPRFSAICLVNALGFAHRRLDVQNLHILPILLQKRHKEVHRLQNIAHQLLLRQIHVTNGNAHAKHLLQLELHCARQVVHFRLHVVVVRNWRREFTRLIQSWAEETRNLTNHCVACNEGVVLLGQLLHELLVLVQLLQRLGVHGVQAERFGLVAVLLVAKHANFEVVLRLLRQAQ